MQPSETQGKGDRELFQIGSSIMVNDEIIIIQFPGGNYGWDRGNVFSNKEDAGKFMHTVNTLPLFKWLPTPLLPLTAYLFLKKMAEF